MSLNNKKWIIIAFVIVVMFLGQLIFSIKDSSLLQKQMIKIANKSHWNLLNRGQSVAVEFNSFDKVWNDSIKFIIVLNHKQESDTIDLPKEYNTNNSIIFVSRINEESFKKNAHCRDWKIITDTTKMLDFLLSSDSLMVVFKIKRNINGQFELKK